MEEYQELLVTLHSMDADATEEEYEKQLEVVNRTLLTVKDVHIKSVMKDLRKDLIELLEIKRRPEAEFGTDDEREETEFDEEYEKYRLELEKKAKEEEPEMEFSCLKRELAVVEESCKKKATEDAERARAHSENSAKFQALRQDIESMIGQLCAAPHKHSWGAVAFHNAIIGSIDDGDNINEKTGKYEVRVRVFYTNPTHREMLPCSYYLDGKCRFDAENCHFSHGELVRARSLRDYKSPKFERLAKNCVVLAKLDDQLWYRGQVLSANFEEKNCRVCLDAEYKGVRERDFEFEELLPILHDDDDDDSSDSDDSDDDSDGTGIYEPEQDEAIILLTEKDIMNVEPAETLGEWEKYTRGMGSKLMFKMGYVLGQGLGSDGRGIIEPISAHVLPPGRSLDACMELREMGESGYFNLEKRLERDLKKQEKLNSRAYEREAQRTDVFTFLNDSVLGGPHTVVNNEAPTTASKKDAVKTLQKQTTKSLNVASMKIGDDIRRKQRDINRLQLALKRHTRGTESYKRLHTQIVAKNHELQALKRQESSVSREQSTRKTKEKLSVF